MYLLCKDSLRVTSSESESLDNDSHDLKISSLAIDGLPSCGFGQQLCGEVLKGSCEDDVTMMP